MNLRRLAKDPESGKHGCMSLYLDGDDPKWCYGQMRKSRRARRQMVNWLRGETAGRIPAQTVIDAARAILAERGETL